MLNLDVGVEVGVIDFFRKRYNLVEIQIRIRKLVVIIYNTQFLRELWEERLWSIQGVYVCQGGFRKGKGEGEGYVFLEERMYVCEY